MKHTNFEERFEEVWNKGTNLKKEIKKFILQERISAKEETVREIIQMIDKKADFEKSSLLKSGMWFANGLIANWAKSQGINLPKEK